MSDPGLERVLGLAKRARDLTNSPKWNMVFEDAGSDHGEACDALWEELYRLLDNRDEIGNPISSPKLPENPAKELKKAIIAELKQEIPGMVASVFERFE